MSHDTPTMTWDMFCNVIDNYGDIGVAWRLARQLSREHGQRIRLWVDDLTSFARVCPQLNPLTSRQQVQDIEVCLWSRDFPHDIVPGDVVLDAFGCTLPDSFLSAMVARAPAVLWINLEYLSAEDWIDCCHGMASPHPRLPLVRHFFFPGFSEKSGGVIAERGLLEAAANWRRQTEATQRYWQDRGVAPRLPGEYWVSLFAYENQAIGELLEQWSGGSQPVRCLVPEGRILPDITSGFCQQALAAGDCLERGALTLQVLPFSDQTDYDRLLWSCDLNFVRGEDSFMRAQWAGQPLVWHIYPQEESAHWVKLDAFWQRYGQGLGSDARQALLALNHAWNHGQNIGTAWRQFAHERARLEAHARRWPHTLLAQGDLASRLLRFIAARR